MLWFCSCISSEEAGVTYDRQQGAGDRAKPVEEFNTQSPQMCS